MPITGKELIKIVERLGWTCKRVNGSHYIIQKEKQVVSIPYHNKEMPKKTLQNIMKTTGKIDGIKL